MNEQYKKKLEQAKNKLNQQQANQPGWLMGVLSNEDIQRIHKSIDLMHQEVQEIVDKRQVEATEDNTKKFEALKLQVEDLKFQLSKGMTINNLKDFQPVIKAPEVNIPEIKVPEPTIIKQDDIFSIYKPADIDEEESTKYYGYLSKDGDWFIMRSTTNGSKTKFRYATGKGEFDKNFGKRHKLDYNYIDKVSFNV